jgi:hypothetical protein
MSFSLLCMHLCHPAAEHAHLLFCRQSWVTMLVPKESLTLQNQEFWPSSNKLGRISDNRTASRSFITCRLRGCFLQDKHFPSAHDIYDGAICELSLHGAFDYIQSLQSLMVLIHGNSGHDGSRAREFQCLVLRANWIQPTRGSLEGPPSC